MDQTMEKNRQKPSWRSWDPENFRIEEQDLPQLAAMELRERFDRRTGGFADLPESQEDGVLLFLLEYARRGPDDHARAMAEVILERRGVNGGGLLACAHLEAYAQTGRPVYREAAKGILDGALKELRLFSGCFAQPGDETVSTAWNAQMIAAMAKASRVLGEERYLRAAEKTWLFLKSRLTQPNGRLWHRWRNQTPLEEGRLLDYGFYCWALVELYEANFAVSCLRDAEILADQMIEIFRDPRGGMYDLNDNSAAGSGTAGLALSKLARLTAVEKYRNLAREQMEWLAGAETEMPGGLGLLGILEESRPRRELVCVSSGKIPAWLAPVGEEYRLNVLAKTYDNSWGLENAAPYVKELPVPESGDRLYLCRDGVCETAVEGLFQFYQHFSPEAGREARCQT